MQNMRNPQQRSTFPRKSYDNEWKMVEKGKKAAPVHGTDYRRRQFKPREEESADGKQVFFFNFLFLFQRPRLELEKRTIDAPIGGVAEHSGKEDPFGGAK
jgi:hypothetical protein